MLKPVKHKKVSDQIYEQLRDMIYRGEYEAGQRLMAERDMASFFGVGRPTVRVAIQKLINNGLVTIKQGVGTFVAENKPIDESTPLFQLLGENNFSVTEFQEIRFALEARSAELAAKRATEEDLHLIEQSLERIRKEKDVGAVQMKTDISLHMNVAYASKNRVLIQFMKNFYDVQLHVMDVAYIKIFKSLELNKLMYDQHFRIVAAIKKHDPEKARAAMEDHIGAVFDVCREHNL